jgi:hypothetical protein
MYALSLEFHQIALIGALTILTLNTQQMYAIIGAGSLVQSSALGGASGLATGAGSNGQSGSNVGGGVDRHLFCDTGVITSICK